MGNEIKNLLKPITINGLEIKNRIVMPPMDCNYAGINGEVTEQLISHYEQRAKHGTGLIIIEATSIVADKKNLVCQTTFPNDSYIPGYENLVERIHAWGAKTIIQLMHPGNEAQVGELVAPSEVTSRIMEHAPRILSVKEIEDLIELFIQAARRARDAGFDGIELHGAHGYLVNEFLSPFYNRRTDLYGGSLENRARFAVQIIEGTKSLLGQKFLIGVRFSADEYIEKGLKINESKKLAKIFQAAGADLLHVSAGIYDSLAYISPPSSMPFGIHIPLAKSIKAEVDIPVITVGKINDPHLAEKVISEGDADLVAFGRALLADDQLPQKIYQGRLDEIRKCIGCKLCLDRNGRGLGVRCAVNPRTGRDRIFNEYLHMAREPQKLLIIGGGPAGMQAAISAKRLGHDVTLIEKENKLGGQLNLAIIPFFKDNHYLLGYLKNQIEKMNIKVVLNQEADVDKVENFNSDVVIIAAGATENELSCLDGVCQENIITCWKALMNSEEIGNHVVVVGGGSTGCETAEILSGTKVELEYLGMVGQGPDYNYKVKSVDKLGSARKVTVIEMLEEVAVDQSEHNRDLLLLRLKEIGVKFIKKAKVQSIVGNTLTYLDVNDLEMKSIEADNFVVAAGVKSRKELFNALSKKGFKVLEIGDCTKPGKIADAIYQGAIAAMQI